MGQGDRGSNYVDCGRSANADQREVREVAAMARSKDVDICRGEDAAGSAVSEGLG